MFTVAGLKPGGGGGRGGGTVDSAALPSALESEGRIDTDERKGRRGLGADICGDSPKPRGGISGGGGGGGGGGGEGRIEIKSTAKLGGFSNVFSTTCLLVAEGGIGGAGALRAKFT